MARHTGQSALVSGASGFVGRHLVRRLVAEGWTVHVLVRPTTDLSCFHAITDAITLHIADGETGSVVEALAAAQPDVVFHLATHFLAQHGGDDLRDLLEANVLFGTQLLHAMEETGCRALVNFGTSWQNFEDSPYRPVNLYAATKQAFEDVLAYYTDVGVVRAVTLRLFDTYGPDDPRKKLFWALANAAENGETLHMSPGAQLIDLTYIDDVTRAAGVAAARVMGDPAHAHEVYALSGGNPVSLKEVVETYVKVTGCTLDVDWGGRAYRPREVMVPWRSGEALPGWRPTVSLEEGLARMVKSDV